MYNHGCILHTETFKMNYHLPVFSPPPRATHHDAPQTGHVRLEYYKGILATNANTGLPIDDIGKMHIASIEEDIGRSTTSRSTSKAAGKRLRDSCNIFPIAHDVRGAILEATQCYKNVELEIFSVTPPTDNPGANMHTAEEDTKQQRTIPNSCNYPTDLSDFVEAPGWIVIALTTHENDYEINDYEGYVRLMSTIRKAVENIVVYVTASANRDDGATGAQANGYMQITQGDSYSTTCIGKRHEYTMNGPTTVQVIAAWQRKHVALRDGAGPVDFPIELPVINMPSEALGATHMSDSRYYRTKMVTTERSRTVPPYYITDLLSRTHTVVLSTGAHNISPISDERDFRTGRLTAHYPDVYVLSAPGIMRTYVPRMTTFGRIQLPDVLMTYYSDDNDYRYWDCEIWKRGLRRVLGRVGVPPRVLGKIYVSLRGARNEDDGASGGPIVGDGPG